MSSCDVNIIKPITLTDANITSNIAEDEAPLFDETVIYVEGYEVIDEHYIWIAQADVPTTASTVHPSEGATLAPPTWAKKSVTNHWAAFDNVVGSQSENAGTIDITIDAGLINAIGLLNVVAKSVQIIVTDPVDGEVFNKTINMIDVRGISGWYDYYLNDIEYKSLAVELTLPAYKNATTQIIISQLGGVAKLGNVVVGKQYYLGELLIGGDMGMVSYSRKVVDEFGNYTVTKRANAKRSNVLINMETARVDRNKEALESLDSTLTLLVTGDYYDSLTVFGFYKDFIIGIQSPPYTECNIQFEGVI